MGVTLETMGAYQGYVVGYIACYLWASGKKIIILHHYLEGWQQRHGWGMGISLISFDKFLAGC